MSRTVAFMPIFLLVFIFINGPLKIGLPLLSVDIRISTALTTPLRMESDANPSLGETQSHEPFVKLGGHAAVAPHLAIACALVIPTRTPPIDRPSTIWWSVNLGRAADAVAGSRQTVRATRN